MGFLAWIGGNWFDLLQSTGIIASLLFAGATFRTDAKSRRIANLIKFTEQHREIWDELERRPALRRILDASVDLSKEPLKPEEERYIGKHILRLNSAYHAIKDSVFKAPEGLPEDVRRFFSRPIANAVWEKMKPMQDSDFVEFVEGCLEKGHTPK